MLPRIQGQGDGILIPAGRIHGASLVSEIQSYCTGVGPMYGMEAAADSGPEQTDFCYFVVRW